MPGCLIALAFLFYFIGVIVWLNQKKIGSENKESATSRRFDFSTGEPIKNTSKDPKNYEASAYTQSEANMEHPGTLLSAYQIGVRILVGHPVQGDLTVYVQGKVIFSELWQRARDTQSPWVPTGNEFVGLSYFQILKSNGTLLRMHANLPNPIKWQKCFSHTPPECGGWWILENSPFDH